MQSRTDNNRKFFYGWVVVLACMLIQAIPYGIAANVKPQFIKFVTQGEGFSLTQFSLVFTLGTIASAIASPFIGKILSKPKTNIKLLFTLGGLLSGGGFLLFSFAGSNIWLYYIIYGIVQVGTAVISAIGVPLLVSSWFTENKGFALGLAFSGGGMGNIVLQQLAAKLLNNPEIGYQGAYFIFGLISMVVAIPVALLLIRLPKAGELSSNNNSYKKSVKNTNVSGYTFNEAKDMKLFWMFALAFLFVGLYVSGMSVQFSGYFYSIGLDPQLVANIASLFAFVSIFGNLFGGVLFDKLGIKTSLILAGITVIGCGLSLIFTPQVNMLGYVFAIGLGFAMFAYIIGPSYLTGALFGNKEFGTILGIVQVFFAFGFAFGSSLFGMVVDMAGGNYIPAWIMVTVFAVVAYGLLLFTTTKIANMNKLQTKETVKNAA
ncbi:MAG: conjugated bile salt MFS transporter [Peptostreptococcaceae bacterium]